MNKNKHDLTLCRTYMSPIVATSSALDVIGNLKNDTVEIDRLL
ncbi:MAG: hypothetical protein R2766_10440 [Saprospiraceae bacterium]